MKSLFRLIPFLIVSFSLCLFFSIPLQASPMEVSMPRFPIMLNKAPLNNDRREHPLLVYQNITYIPLSAEMCDFLGLSVSLESTNSLLISSKQTAHLFLDVGENPSISHPSLQEASLLQVSLLLDGVRIDDHLSGYPILSLQGTIYLPLTWSLVVDALQWGYSFDSETGFSLVSRDPLRLADDTGVADVEIWALKNLHPNYYADNMNSACTTAFIGCITLKEDLGTRALGFTFPGIYDQQQHVFIQIDNTLFAPIQVNETRGITLFLHGSYANYMELLSDPAFILEKGAIEVNDIWGTTSDITNLRIYTVGGLFFTPFSFELANMEKENIRILSASFIYQILDTEENVIVEYPLIPPPTILEKKSVTSITTPFWDGRDKYGQQLPNGRYLKRMKMIPFTYQLVDSQTIKTIEPDAFFPMYGNTRSIFLER